MNAPWELFVKFLSWTGFVVAVALVLFVAGCFFYGAFSSLLKRLKKRRKA